LNQHLEVFVVVHFEHQVTFLLNHLFKLIIKTFNLLAGYRELGLIMGLLILFARVFSYHLGMLVDNIFPKVIKSSIDKLINI